MKTTLLVLLASIQLAFAGINCLYVESRPVEGTLPARYETRSYGQLPDGKTKEVTLTSDADKQIVTDLIAAAYWELGGKTFKCVTAYFNADGTMDRIDFIVEEDGHHLFWSCDADASTKVSALKTLIEGK